MMTCVRCDEEIQGEPFIHQPSGWELCQVCACAHDVCGHEHGGQG